MRSARRLSAAIRMRRVSSTSRACADGAAHAAARPGRGQRGAPPADRRCGASRAPSRPGTTRVPARRRLRHARVPAARRPLVGVRRRRAASFKEEKLPARSAPNPVIRQRDRLSPRSSRRSLWAARRQRRGRRCARGREHVPAARRACPARVGDARVPAARAVCGGPDVAGVSPSLQPFATPRARAARANFAETDGHPRTAIETVGYKAQRSASIVGRAVEAGTLRAARVGAEHFLRELRDGYAVFTFDPER